MNRFKKLIAAILLIVSFTFSFTAKAEYFWVSTREDVFLRPSVDNLGASVALLRYGDIVQVTGCVPSCNDRYALVSIAPFGATRLSNLSPIAERTREAHFLSNGPENFIWAKLTAHHGITINRTEHYDRGDELFFIARTPTTLVRANGTPIPLNLLEEFQPSAFSGWMNPPGNGFVFVIRDSTRIDGRTNQTIPVHRYDRFPVFDYSRRERMVTLQSPLGALTDRTAVRYGHARERPTNVPRGAQWIHVDLDEQVLTAYDRNDNLVFATLVSTGSARHRTREGTFTVRRKIRYTQMRGGGSRPYSVEGVPWVMYFDDAIALHGAFWHDQFGTRRSHGCVNLSVTDAKWLWNWTEVVVPTGWRSVHPEVTLAPVDNIWVVVEER